MMLDETMRHTRALYIDLESTCWNQTPPSGMTPEIIEIGIVELDLIDLRITQEAAYFVRPRQWEISQKCTKLTGITSDDIQHAKTFPEVLAAVVEKFRPKATPCCAWGDDFALLTKACNSEGLANPFRQPIDLCKSFQGILAAKQQPSLVNALELMGLQFEGFPHGALNDARNTARLHIAILRQMRMRRETQPTSTKAVDQAASLSPFAQKLAHALK